ncbi:MAG: helix-hairpin-helix domain-containing protein [Cyanobacteria bacterium J06648_11]
MAQSTLELSFPAERVTWFQQTLLDWSCDHFREFPWRETRDPYRIFLAETLLQKTNAAKVLPIYLQAIARFPTLEALAEAPLDELADLLQPLGLQFRAERLWQAARLLAGDREIFSDEVRLLQLPGVGPYTARAVLANAFELPRAVLDANVARIMERFWGVRGGRVKSRDPLLWATAEYVAPKTGTSRWNLTMIDFGAIVCRARQPRCQDCPLRSRCDRHVTSLSPSGSAI